MAVIVKLMLHFNRPVGGETTNGLRWGSIKMYGAAALLKKMM